MRKREGRRESREGERKGKQGMSTADSPPTHPGDLPCAASTKMSKTLSAILSQRVCISSCSLCEGVRDEGVRVCRSRGYMYVKVTQ